MNQPEIQTHPLFARVEAALESVRGYLQTDGGDVRIVSIREDNIVELELLGSCSTCSMIDTTLKLGVEQAVLRAVPEITGVTTAQP